MTTDTLAVLKDANHPRYEALPMLQMEQPHISGVTSK
ncbi:hypothetical protein OPFLODJI_03146 [Aeromonas hydrophila]